VTSIALPRRPFASSRKIWWARLWSAGFWC
jgi:hypothetical protein